jgi:hypothetical protein
MNCQRTRQAMRRIALASLICVSGVVAAARGSQGSGQPSIAALTITPSRIAAGEITVLAIELDRPAPEGFVVGISQITNTGVTDTIVEMPTSARFDAGVRRFPITIRTQRKTDRVTDIVFTAFHGNDKKSAQLIIN